MAGEVPPGPRGVPLLGMLPALRRDPLRVFMDAAARFGDVAFFKIGSRRGYLITNPADVRHVLQDNARNYRKSPLYQKLRTSLGDGLLTSEGAFWLRQRRIAQPAFHRQRIEAFAGVMTDAAAETAAHWETLATRRTPVEIGDEMMRLTRTVVLRALLGATLAPSRRRSMRRGRRSISRLAKASGRSALPKNCRRRRSGIFTLRGQCCRAPSITLFRNVVVAGPKPATCCRC